jgi:hypothetical protein
MKRVIQAVGHKGQSKWVIETEEQQSARQEPISSYERLQIAGVNLARLEGEKRDLLERLECAEGDCKDAMQQLKVMAEDRDEYRKHYEELTKRVHIDGKLHGMTASDIGELIAEAGFETMEQRQALRALLGASE